MKQNNSKFLAAAYCLPNYKSWFKFLRNTNANFKIVILEVSFL
jgi:hypothetical protein